MEKIGITTTVPIEVIYAAKKKPVDLNNLFITNTNRKELIEKAEVDGFPRNICAWIKGLYGTSLAEDMDAIIGVVEGDCSSTQALLDVWKLKGVKTIPFGYPQNKEYESIKKEIDYLAKILNVSIEEVEKTRLELYPIRQKLKELDNLTWKENIISGFENHIWQLMSSDFEGNPKLFEEELDIFIDEVKIRKPFEKDNVRLGYIGVPPILDDIYSVVEENSGRVIYNEVQRAFTMAKEDKNSNIYNQYLSFTYPYDLDSRIEDIKKEIEVRKLDGIIHYTQSFCHRGIEDIIIKSKIDIPVITIETDLPGKVDARTRLRIESFLDMLNDLKG